MRQYIPGKLQGKESSLGNISIVQISSRQEHQMGNECFI